mgnify:FL=1
MNWRFWRRKGEATPVAHTPEPDIHVLFKEQASLLEGLQAGYLALQEQQQETARLVNNLARMQHRWNRDQTGKLDRAIEDKARSADLERLLETSVDGLLILIDDMDTILEHHDRSVDNPWIRVINQWQKQVEVLLQKLGVEPIPLLGTLFDPQTAEAMDTVTREEAMKKAQNGWHGVLEPYTVVDVIRKGYQFADGSVRRKALVLTIEEESNEPGKTPSNEEWQG